MKSATGNKRTHRGKMRGFGIVVCGLLMLSTSFWVSAAQAKEEQELSPPEPTVSADNSGENAEGEHPSDSKSPEPRYYGNQIVLADGIADSMFLTAGAFGFFCALSNMDLTGNGGSSDSGGLCTVTKVTLGLSAATYALAPPIIHGAHGRPGAAFGSLGLRVGLPGSALVASSVFDEDLGFFVFSGRVAASLIDWFVLAYEEPQVAERSSSEVKLRPTLLLGKADAGIGLNGQF